jgi:DNA-binding NtrC family response regulator
VIARTLEHTGGDVPRAAELLQIPMRMLNSKLRDYKLR